MSSVFSRLRRLSVIGLIFVAACGAETTAPAVETEPGGAAVDPSGLSGTFATLGGTDVDLETLQGQDVVLWFWAPW